MRSGKGAVPFSVLKRCSMIRLMMVMLMSYSCVVSVVLVLFGLGLVLRSKDGVEAHRTPFSIL